ncbi:hypothetical protein [Odoribacter lunatus]|uniref:hypothetical protein n=1 Tax=Odoribacter lunatus TaxID=2941335 RepID=UPI00203D83EF|nr:hypothetical protein [Odoribacter lunatus]
MRSNLIMILIGMVSGFMGIIPLLRQKADKYWVFALFLFYFMMPYVIFHIALPGVQWWLKGSIVSLFLVLPLVIAAGRGYKRCVFPILITSVLVGLFISLLGHYLL